jgi:hypothetical protein
MSFEGSPKNAMKKLSNTTFSRAALILASTQVAPAAVFAFRIDNAGTTAGSPIDDGQNFQQQWGKSENWTLVSGVDDGDNGYPDGADTFTIDRTTLANNSTRLTEESAPAGLIDVAGITGTGTGNQDIVLKLRAFTIGNLESLASAAPFHIRAERDRNITINGVISGEGDLLLSRSGGFSDGVDDDELITITGEAPNTITGTIRLYNDNGNADNPQPSYWVADKVGAFGQTSALTLEGRAGLSGIASLQITTNTLGGEGAIDDDATELYIGAEGVLNIEAGVNEVIGEDKLFTDLEGLGTYTAVAPGTYNNSVDWIIGEGSVTVGAFSAPLAITEITYALDAELNQILTLTWNSVSGRVYAVIYSTDMINWDSDLDDGVPADAGETTTEEFDLTGIPELNSETKAFFRVEERP